MMIRLEIRQAVKPLYLAGVLLKEIKQELGIDGFTLKHAIHPSWRRPRRQLLDRIKTKRRTQARQAARRQLVF